MHAGLERDGEGLALLTDDPHPLVRLIAASALAREESRGAHQRRDFPDLDPALDGRHVTLVSGDRRCSRSGADGPERLFVWTLAPLCAQSPGFRLTRGSEATKLWLHNAGILARQRDGDPAG